jgi:hypothetical protein
VIEEGKQVIDDIAELAVAIAIIQTVLAQRHPFEDE